MFWSEDVVAYPRRGKGSDVGLCKALFAFVLWFLGKVFPTCAPRVEDDLGPSLPRCWGVFSCVAVSVFVLEKAFVLASFSVFPCQTREGLSLQVFLHVFLHVFLQVVLEAVLEVVFV